MAGSTSADFDRRMMAIALRMAARGLGNVAPNPAVGAVIADKTTGEVIARGWTQPGGRPHAETEAIARAGARARGATIYVTLEPCSHHGRTPPCADAIVAAGLSRVVTAIEDPDPRVAGRGLDRLRAAGIAVERGVLAGEAYWLTRGHIVRITERRPFVQLKLAVGPEGDVPRAAAGKPVWVTGREARANGHLLRARADAILVGSGTVRDDDPELTCRLPGLAIRSPLRVVLATNLDIPLTSKLVTSARDVPVLIVCARDAHPVQRARLEAEGCEVVAVTSIAGALWLPAVLEALAGRGITRLLVEGGPSIWRAFANATMVDEVALYVGGGALHADFDQAVRIAGKHLGGLSLTCHNSRALGADRLYHLRRASLAAISPSQPR